MDEPALNIHILIKGMHLVLPYKKKGVDINRVFLKIDLVRSAFFGKPNDLIVAVGMW